MKKSLIILESGNEVIVSESVALQLDGYEFKSKKEKKALRKEYGDRMPFANEHGEVELSINPDCIEIIQYNYTGEQLSNDFFLTNKNSNTLKVETDAAEMIQIANDRPVLQSKELMDVLGFILYDQNTYSVYNKFGYVINPPTLVPINEPAIKIKTVNQLLTELANRDYDVDEAVSIYLT